MIIDKQVFLDMINSPVRYLRGRVEIFEGSTLALICGCHDNLKSFTVERTGELGKFFGFGICQKLNVHLIDPKREINVTTAHNLEVEFGVGSDYIYPCPNFYVTEVNRDENTNELSITGYDALYPASKHTVSELELVTPYTLKQFAEACASLLGLPMKEITDASFDTNYPYGGNFDGTETIREALNAVAEATQTIYYIDKDWELTFKRLDRDGEPVVILDREKYVSLDSKPNRRLSAITHATELGDNVTAKLEVSGTTQYVRDNPFWELRDDIGELVDNALAAIGGITINQFECSWRGNFLLEIGDKIGLITKDNETAVSYILDDTFTFNGSLSGKTQWKYTASSETETETNPTSIGEALKQTYARVDKANRQIELVASEINNNNEAISSLQVNTTNISSTVTKLEKETTETLNTVAELSTMVNQTAENLEISISNTKQEITEAGVEKVVTKTGFTFDDEGLTVSRTGSELSTTISENGMVIERGNAEVLTVKDTGVDAMNLHATTYLFVGVNSRFQDYANNTRTGCFWIGK